MASLVVSLTACHSTQNALGIAADNQTTSLLLSSDPIYKISYDNLTMMPQLRSTYDGRLTYKNLQSCKIVCDSVRKLAYDIPALLKLRPYGATQIFIIIIFLKEILALFKSLS